MDWLDQELSRLQSAGDTGTSASVTHSAGAIATWWRRLGDVLQRYVDRANDAGVASDLTRNADNTYRVSNAAAGLALEITLDPATQKLVFNYRSTASDASAPEGGIMSLREERGAIRPYYSDQELNDAQISETLLKPVLFPALPSDEIAA